MLVKEERPFVLASKSCLGITFRGSDLSDSGSGATFKPPQSS
jgi:hypothetical protein